MNYDLNFKLVTLILGGVTGIIATWRIVVELIRGKHGSLRDEYKFAKEFLNDLKANSGMHPFLKQKGLQAIAGNTNLSTVEVEYLLSLQDSARALKDYAFGGIYLEHRATAGGQQISFRVKYSTPWSRRWRKAAYVALYLVFYFAALAPLFLFVFKVLQLSPALSALAFCMIFFLPMAILALRAAIRIGRAEALVRTQYQPPGNSLHAGIQL